MDKLFGYSCKLQCNNTMTYFIGTKYVNLQQIKSIL